MPRYRPLLVLFCLAAAMSTAASGSDCHLATFTADVTIPIGHRCMGVLEVKAHRIDDPLLARGFVLFGPTEPIVLVAVDWCEIRNDAYQRWRDVLAEAAGTTRERVLVSSLHQHDAPVVDLGGEALLADVGLASELCDVAFHETAVQRVANALRASLSGRRPVTHIGLGRSRVEQIASNRRVVHADGRVGFDRGSASGGNAFMREAPDGLIDPWLKTISFWEGETPLLAIHAYATHPMSHYGRGVVSADFVGMARRRMQVKYPKATQIYVTGCSGDVTAGKYNDGSSENRPILADRLFQAMEDAWLKSRRHPLGSVSFRSTKLSLEFNDDPAFTVSALQRKLDDKAAKVRDRILAAMGLASRNRLARPIDLPCIDFGVAQIVLFPGESFVGYQLRAERMRSDSFVLSIGFGECWPGYVPTRSAFEDRFGHSWRWVAPGAESRIREALWRVLPGKGEMPGAGKGIVNDVFPATDANPRYSEGSILPLANDALLFAVTEFVGDESDFAKASIVARTSIDGGENWGPRRVLQENVGAMNVMSVSLKRFRTAGNSGIGLFYLVKNGYDELDVFMRLSTDEAETFGEPVRVTSEPGYHVMNNDRVVQLLDGRLLCPVAWTRDVRTENHFVSFCYFSDDGGKTWQAGKGRIDLPQRGAMEPEVVEQRDDQLLMILRTQLGEIYACSSSDRGNTWSQPAAWGVESPESPATLGRIPSTGDLLLVWNPKGVGHGGPRTPLAAAISQDDGKTWRHQRNLEDGIDWTYAYSSQSFLGNRVLVSYYVRDETTGRISSRFRSLPLKWFYE